MFPVAPYNAMPEPKCTFEFESTRPTSTRHPHPRACRTLVVAAYRDAPCVRARCVIFPDCEGRIVLLSVSFSLRVGLLIISSSRHSLVPARTHIYACIHGLHPLSIYLLGGDATSSSSSSTTFTSPTSTTASPAPHSLNEIGTYIMRDTAECQVYCHHQCVC